MIRGLGRLLAGAFSVAVLVAVTPGTALAHNQLRFADPADTSALAAAPRQVTLTFSERLDPQFTTVAVTDAAGGAMTAGPVQVSDTTAVQPLVPTLGAGAFTVAYRVVSVDGHPVTGSLKFTVTLPDDPAASGTPTAVPSETAPGGAVTSATPVADTGDDPRGPGAILWVVAIVAVVAGLGVVVARSRRRSR